MFIGHYAVALGAKRLAPSISLGALFLACQLADLIWPNLVLLGIEKVKIDPGDTALTPLDFVYYPYSHSLLAMAVWGALFAVLYLMAARVSVKTAAVILALVLSHWVLDALTHRPDLPVTFGGSARIGLGLWNLPALAVSVELVLFGMGIWMYANCTKPTDRRGSFGFWGLIAFLLLVYIANIAANFVGPPPPSAGAVAWSAQAMWLLVIWAYWIDRHRIPTAERIA
jgi:hypothetical protein